VLLFEVRYFAVLLLYPWSLFVERLLVIALQPVEDFSLEYFEFQWDRDDGGDQHGEHEAWAGGRELAAKRSEAGPAVAETHDDRAVQIENEYAPEEAEADGIWSGLKHGPERVAPGETRQDGGQDNRRTDPRIDVVVC